MKKVSIVVLFCVFLCVHLTATAQLSDTKTYMQKKQHISKTGMITLTSWAGVNIVTGTAGWIATEGESKYFNQMNVLWNVVNLGIALPGLISANKSIPENTSMGKLISEQYRSEQLYLINTSLNVVYIGSGMAMKALSKDYPNNEARLQGFGNSLLLQGGFLFVFDIVQYFRHRTQRKNANDLFIDRLSLSSNGIGLRYTFR